MKDITFSYDLFIKNNDINFITDSVSNIDTTKQSITLKDNNIKYDKLIVSPGVKLEYEKIVGLTDALIVILSIQHGKPEKKLDYFLTKLKI